MRIKSVFGSAWSHIARHPGIVVSYFVAAVIGAVTDPTQQLSVGLTPDWFYVALPSLVLEQLRSPTFWAMTLLTVLLQTGVTILVSEEVALAYDGTRTGIKSSLLRLKLSSWLWFLIVFSILTALFLLVGFMAIAASRYFWLTWRIDTRLGVLLLAILLYPLYYLSLAAASMVAVFQVDSLERLVMLRLLAERKVLVPLYGFYCVRLVVEIILGVVLPVAFIILLQNKILSLISFCVAIVVPFALLRGSAYEMKLSAMKRRTYVSNRFSDFFQSRGNA